MGKIGELWAKLSLNKDNFSKGLNGAGKDTASFGNKIKQMGTLAKGVWAAIGVAAVKMVKGFINSSNTMGDAWSKSVAGMSSRWQNFTSRLNRSIADTGGSLKKALLDPIYFGKMLVKAVSGGGEGDVAEAAGKALAEAQDAMFEVENTFSLRMAKLGPKLNELYMTMMNTALGDAERAAAGKEYRALNEAIYSNKAKALKNVLDKTLKNWSAITGVSGYSNEQLIELFEMLGDNEERVKREFSDFYKAYESKGDVLNGAVVSAILNYRNVINEMNDKLRRTDRTTMNLENASLPKTDIADIEIKEETVDYAAIASEQIDAYVDAIYMGKARVESAWDDILNMADDVEWELPELDTNTADAQLAGLVSSWQDSQDQSAQISELLESQITDSLATLGEGIGNLINGGGMEEFSSMMLSQIGSFAKSFGKMIIGFGVAASGLNEIIKHPYLAIAAGAALVALGQVATNAAQNMVSNFTGGGASTSGASSASSSSSSTRPEKMETEMTIYVKGKIDGKDILLSGERAAAYYGR